ncbi:hypothetical protein SISSUDRAFT_1037633 [Sistotremastrum suecicum HHB10207 ss-3]|uniref:Uncharacterized protein n=1 Tax=Sistotremastrum suecicum HHB10207 ss-3 TaxID=1314776 RepID=A0A165XVL3_9AGAM|nr:hypothetical protein SISSUDRAFT_1037633 [Sistotremastrum suecicum HHB10207 ss-3]
MVVGERETHLITLHSAGPLEEVQVNDWTIATLPEDTLKTGTAVPLFGWWIRSSTMRDEERICLHIADENIECKDAEVSIAAIENVNHHIAIFWRRPMQSWEQYRTTPTSEILRTADEDACKKPKKLQRMGLRPATYERSNRHIWTGYSVYGSAATVVNATAITRSKTVQPFAEVRLRDSSESRKVLALRRRRKELRQSQYQRIFNTLHRERWFAEKEGWAALVLFADETEFEHGRCRSPGGRVERPPETADAFEERASRY